VFDLAACGPIDPTAKQLTQASELAARASKRVRAVHLKRRLNAGRIQTEAGVQPAGRERQSLAHHTAGADLAGAIISMLHPQPSARARTMRAAVPGSGRVHPHRRTQPCNGDPSSKRWTGRPLHQAVAARQAGSARSSRRRVKLMSRRSRAGPQLWCAPTARIVLSRLMPGIGRARQTDGALPGRWAPPGATDHLGRGGGGEPASRRITEVAGDRLAELLSAAKHLGGGPQALKACCPSQHKLTFHFLVAIRRRLIRSGQGGPNRPGGTQASPMIPAPEMPAWPSPALLVKGV